MEAAEALFNGLSLAFLFIVGLGLGATSTVEDFKAASAKPKAVCTGFASQYLFMPVMAYLLCLIFDVDPSIAIGTVLVGCSPGGTTSNIFTYWSSGDVALSITMSFLSTAAAFFMMPFWIWLLVKVAFDSDVQIAWLNIVAALLLILMPTAAGLATRHYNTETKIGGKFIWQWIEVATTVFGVLFLLAALISSLIIYGPSFADTPASVWIMGVIMQPLGCAFGYYVAKLLDMPCKDRRTISLETGVQNFTLTIAVINLTFEGKVLEDALMFPLAYGLLYFANSAALVAFYRWYLAPMDDQDGQLDSAGKELEAVRTDDPDPEMKSISLTVSQD